MALFDKLFSIKRILDSECEASNRGRSCSKHPEQIRVLLFKECDWRGRKLIFDSSVIQKVPSHKNVVPDIKQTNQVPCILEVSEGFTYVYKGPATDATVLGEMIFGAVAMNYKSVSLKIHIMDEPRRLMCTKVFCVPTNRRVNRAEQRSDKPSKIDSSCSLQNGSKALNVPLLKEEGVSLSFSLERGDSGFYGDLPSFSSIGSTYDYYTMFDNWDGDKPQDDDYSFHSPPGRKLSTSSNGSWQRRTFQNILTRFDLGQSSNLLSVPTVASNVTSNDSQLYSNSSTSGTSDSFTSTGSAVAARRNKLGLALLITATDPEMDVVRKCLEHSPQLQALLCRLRVATLVAGASGRFVSTLHRATEDAARCLADLIRGPRLQSIWLGMVTSDTRAANKLANTLLSDICAVLSVGDTKDTNFFISTLITHVLTYHLGWVTTVSPYDTIDCQKNQPVSEPKRPYNALWAQLNDLCGSIGVPTRTARTIISGSSNTKFLKKLLAVLTYFLRCGDVKQFEFQFCDSGVKESKVISINAEAATDANNVNVPLSVGLRRIATHAKDFASGLCDMEMRMPEVNTQNSNSSVTKLVASEVSIKKSSTLANLSQKLSSSSEFLLDHSSTSEKSCSGLLKRNQSALIVPLKASSESSLDSIVTEDNEPVQKVVFVLGDNEKLVGLKNKSSGGKSVKKSSKAAGEATSVAEGEVCATTGCDQETRKSPSRCCGQTLQHSKPIKHSGFKFEFDKYPQIVTNYMKSKNLEILDRHYIGKPGNLKLNNYQFDPTIVPPIQEERCETCEKCQMMESILQTPTNASEMEYMNDIPRQLEPQYAKETIVKVTDKREVSPKTFVRVREENTIVVNIEPRQLARKVRREKAQENMVEVKQVIEFPMPAMCERVGTTKKSGFDTSLLGGVTDHYVPDLVLQGTNAKPNEFEMDLRRDLDLTSYLSKTLETPVKAVAIVGDTNTWEVRVLGRGAGCAGGMSALVAAMLDSLAAMRHARVPAPQCISFLEGKLRELCVLSKTLADMLISTDFCDIATLTKSLNIDVNDVPLLLAVATTHTPQVATRYGISYR